MVETTRDTTGLFPRRDEVVNLTEIIPKIKPYMLEVEKTLQQTISSNAPVMDAITHYILLSPGKRLRPALFLVSAGLDQPPPGLTDTAASIELIHTASLVHDDIVDQSTLRRGLPTVNAKWGNDISVLAGDFLFARAFILLTKSRCQEIITILAAVIERMSVGEIEQLTDVFNAGLPEEVYLDRIKKKTACFMAGVCQAGGVARDAGQDELRALYEFGMYLGLAFQIKDDILDFQGQSEVTGKPAGSDLRQGIITLPVIHLLESSPRRESIKGYIQKKELTDEHLVEILQEIKRAGSLEYCENLVRANSRAAQKALEGLRDRDIKDDLDRILQANAQREF